MTIDSTFKPTSIGQVVEALAREATDVVAGQWTSIKKDLTPYLKALANAVLEFRQMQAAGQLTDRQADYILHGQEVALNSYLQYVTVVTYATAQKVLNAVMTGAAQIVKNLTGLDLSWLAAA